ncbi:hypothetical protein BS1321_02305 [Peribacillus simplex NBRC 15720 = DSM 1321]|uniref:Uncharacterized protein n=1 Tax=Peribacillus simplex NBRC 15720 = DSM 1321 TaxID=1349754 RepID=A0A223ECC6_9BACI|nr:hypothetical protein BS1321_02305 [Peribacillus simplex NBRC 15720 = DSM 1321]
MPFILLRIERGEYACFSVCPKMYYRFEKSSTVYMWIFDNVGFSLIKQTGQIVSKIVQLTWRLEKDFTKLK